MVRLWSYISHSKSKVSRALSYISFTLMALLYSFLCKKPDLLYTYHPQSTTGLIGVLLKKFKKVPFITDVQDLWPDSLIATGFNKDGAVIKTIGRWCNYIYSQAKCVVVLSNGFKCSLISRGVDPKKIHLIYNWCPEESRIKDILLSSSYKVNSGFPAQLMYAGNLGAAQSLISLIDAVGNLPASDIEFQIYGNGVEKENLEAHVANLCYKNIFFKGYLPPSEIFNVLVLSDVLAVHLGDEDLFKITIPSKTQSSMALNKPLLMAVGGEANSIVENAAAGVTALPDSQSSIQKALVEFLAQPKDWVDMGCNARQYYLENFSIASNYNKIDLLLEEVRA